MNTTITTELTWGILREAGVDTERTTREQVYDGSGRLMWTTVAADGQTQVCYSLCPDEHGQVDPDDPCGWVAGTYEDIGDEHGHDWQFNREYFFEPGELDGMLALVAEVTRGA